ncbi:MAG TPA: adenylate/guanylate cyclase domain-containing protein, partial [Anaerolineales bacterium]
MNSTVKQLSVYIPQDRLHALAAGQSLPDRVQGAALFVDISGFTPLTEKLTRRLGARHGIEELGQRINAVYDVLIQIIERQGGSVIAFAGDAITCWFDEQVDHPPLRAVSAAFAIQEAMRSAGEISVKVAVASGPARRFGVGDPHIQLFDTLAGDTISRLATAEHLILSGEIAADEATLEACGGVLQVGEYRTGAEPDERFAILISASKTTEPTPEMTEPGDVPLNALQTWLPPAVYAQAQSGLEEFLTELRPAVSLFLRFGGIDYDRDESAGTKLDELVQRLQQTCAKYEGALLQLTIGDKGNYLYICFGASTAHEDDSRRAVRAAKELAEQLHKLPYLQAVQIGISQGILRVGAFGGATRRTYGAMGDDVNLAARLMTAAGPGEILISGRVQQSLGEQFTLEPRPPLRLKGKAEPLPVFAVTGLQHRRATRLLEPAYRLPMIGRQTDLKRIADILELARQSKGQVIGITAEAGMGKSRLVAEAIRLAHSKGFAGYGGACESSGTHTPYQVWKSIWQAFFDTDPSAPLRRQLRNLEGEIEDRAPVRLQAMPLLAPVLDLEIEDNDFTHLLEPKDRHTALTALLVDCLTAAANEEPILIVLEDAHWIDALSNDLLEALGRATVNSMVCFVLAYRPPELDLGQALKVEAFPNFTKIALNELAPADAEQLMRAKLALLFPERSGGLPQALVKPLTDLAQGNPFFLEELLNYLHDRGISPYDEQALSALELPSSLHTLILSRIDRLSEKKKVTLKAASIIGRLFPFAWLHGYYPALGASEAVKADLHELARLDLTPLETPEPELAYLFKHIITHDVAYENLAYATRAQLHEQLAQYLEAQDGERRLDLLAFHYGRSENLPKQREYLRKAGDAAQATYANQSAVDYYQRLLDLLPWGDRDWIEVSLNLGRVFQLIGQSASAEGRFREALAQAEKRQDPILIAQGEVALAGLMMVREQYTEALPILEQARARFSEAGDRLGLCQALAREANAQFQIAKSNPMNLGTARAMVEECIALARQVDRSRITLTGALDTLEGIAFLQDDDAVRQAALDE